MVSANERAAIDAAVVAAILRRAKREVRRDVADGRVPSRVASLSEVHEHVDGNLYGGMLEVESPAWCLVPETDADRALHERAEWAAQIFNRVMALLDAWVRAGGHAATEPTGARVVVMVTCPACGYEPNYIDADDPDEDMLHGPESVLCDGCGEPFQVDAAAIHAGQHEMLRLLGEA